MKFFPKHIFLIFLTLSLVTFSSCDKEISSTDFGIFSAQNDSTVVMNGVIDENTPQYWENYISMFPRTNQMIMKDCPGSDDDESNLRVARKVRQQNLSIHLPANAEIASGAVDFFLAGTSRTREAGSKIGVHSWSDGKNDATAFPRGDENHLPYIEYYQEMGFSQTASEALYYFTIEAAPAEDIHWMTNVEIEKYGLLTK
ncbi:MAG: hypothetical protein ACPG49_06875 [Chitinophagales bacterium]